jgi:anti-sigma B factor antagonist
MTAHRHLRAIPGGGAQYPAPVNGRPGRVVVPQDDGVPPGVLTAQLHKARAKGPVRLQLRGELDFATADQFCQAIDVAWALGTGRLVIDLRGVVFMDLTSVQILLNAQREAAEAARSLAIIVGDAARRVLQRAGLVDYFEVLSGVAPDLGGPSVPMT